MLSKRASSEWRMACYRGVITTTLFFFIVGCAGRTPNPVADYQYGDENKSCNHLKSELAQIGNDIVLKTQSKSSTAFANTGLFVVGLFLLWPLWFAMDLKNADGIEVEALQKRHNALVRHSADKDCGIEVQQIKIEQPKPAPVMEENG